MLLPICRSEQQSPTDALVNDLEQSSEGRQDTGEQYECFQRSAMQPSN